jgi:hypothetical protein
MVDDGKNSANTVITNFLNTIAIKWYKPQQVSFVKNSEYLSNDAMLKRRMLFTSWNVSSKQTLCTIEKTTKEWLLILHAVECSKYASTTFRDYLKRINAVFETEVGMSMESFNTNKKTVTILWNEERYTADAFLSGIEFGKISIPFFSNLGLYSSDESTISNLWYEIIKSWVGSVNTRNVILEMIDDKHWHICMEKLITTIDIDVSTNPENDVMRWQENSAKLTSNNTKDFGKQDLETILIDNAISVPTDARFVGISRSPEGEKPPCYIIRYEHWVNDPAIDISNHENAYPEYYSNPGFINVEGDFIVLYIDSVNRKIFSMYKKWRSVRDCFAASYDSVKLR